MELQITAKCPNCGEVAKDAYHTGGEPEIQEFECDNLDCRCQVFQAAPQEENHD